MPFQTTVLQRITYDTHLQILSLGNPVDPVLHSGRSLCFLVVPCNPVLKENTEGMHGDLAHPDVLQGEAGTVLWWLLPWPLYLFKGLDQSCQLVCSKAASKSHQHVGQCWLSTKMVMEWNPTVSKDRLGRLAPAGLTR